MVKIFEKYGTRDGLFDMESELKRLWRRSGGVLAELVRCYRYD
jgi:hypothetical protein